MANGKQWDLTSTHSPEGACEWIRKGSGAKAGAYDNDLDFYVSIRPQPQPSTRTTQERHPMTATLDKPAEKEAPAAKSAITLNHFKHALRVAGGAIQRASTIPILQGVRMEQMPTGLAIEGTDLDVAIRALVPESNGPTAPLVIPAEKLTAWVKLLAGEDVTISTTTAHATLQCGRSRAVMPVLPAGSWPDTRAIFAMKGDGISLKQGDLARALGFAMIAVSHEESRYTLNGVLFQGDGTVLKMVATDGSRMMVYSMPCAEKISLLVSARFIKATLPLLADADEGVDLTHDDKTILASIAAETAVLISAPRMSGTFPNWTAVFPKEKRATVRVDAKALLASLGRCALLTDKRSGLVTLHFDERLTLTASSPSNGESEETVDFTGTVKTPLKIGICGEYLIDLIKKLDGELEISLPDANDKPLLCNATPHEGESLSYIIMPMRLR